MNVSVLLDAAETHLSKGRDAAAEKLFTEALERPGGAIRAVRGLGAIALRAGDTEKAHDLFGRALVATPENADLLVGLAAVHLATQREEEAETCLRRAMRLDPTLPDAPANLALILVSRDELKGAHALARRAMELAPEKPEIVTTLANVEMLQGNIAAARSLFEKAAALGPDAVEALVNLGTLFRIAGDAAGAVDALERARLREPDAPSVLARLAECKIALGAFEAAQNLVRQAVAVAPADGDVRNAEGMVMLHSGCYAEALSSLRLAARYSPNNPAPLVNLAVLMRRNNQMEGALAAVRQAIALEGSADAGARRIEFDLLCMMGDWREAWRSNDAMWFGERTRGDDADASDDTVVKLGSRVALLVDDLSSSLMAVRLLPRLACAERRIRLLCLPVYASFFRALPGIGQVEGRETIDVSREIEAGESPLLLDDLPRRMRATPACLAEPGLGLKCDPLSSGAVTDPADPADPADPHDPPTVGLWWDDTPGGPDPQALLNALPGVPVLLRAPGPGQALASSDGRAPRVLVDDRCEHLLDMARALLSLDLVVAVDGAVAHLCANLGCRTAVICPIDPSWHWQPCGPRRERWYPTARAVPRDPGGSWSTLTAVCENLLAGTDERSESAAAADA